MAVSFAIPGATACEWLDESCPDGYWRRRAGEACVPLPDLDAGTDAGPPAADAGPPDGGSDAAAPSDAGADGATPSDAATDGGESADASSADASSDGGDAG